MLWNNVTTKEVKNGSDIASLQNYVKQKHTFIFWLDQILIATEFLIQKHSI